MSSASTATWYMWHDSPISLRKKLKSPQNSMRLNSCSQVYIEKNTKFVEKTSKFFKKCEVATTKVRKSVPSSDL